MKRGHRVRSGRPQEGAPPRREGERPREPTIESWPQDRTGGSVLASGHGACDRLDAARRPCRNPQSILSILRYSRVFGGQSMEYLRLRNWQDQVGPEIGDPRKRMLSAADEAGARGGPRPQRLGVETISGIPHWQKPCERRPARDLASTWGCTTAFPSLALRP
jgi:hypothetical protein